MPTLLQINFVVNSGSTGRIAEQLGAYVQNRGWNSFIAYGRNERPSVSQKIKIGSPLVSFVHAVGSILLDAQGLFSVCATKRLINQIMRIRPDVIHLHNLHGDYLNYRILFTFLAEQNIPVVWSFHDCWPITGHCTHFEYVNCMRWQTECYACPQLKMYPRSIGLDRSRANYLAKKESFTSVSDLTVVAVSEWLKGVVQASFLKEKAICRIYNGLDTDAFYPKDTRKAVALKYGIQRTFWVIGVASIWSGRKGLSDILSLSKLVDCDTQFILVGVSEKQLRILPSNVIGIKRTEDTSALADLYAASDVFINPSPEETFGLTTAESLSCGTPVIVCNTTASPELVTHETGFVVEPHDFEAMHAALLTVRKKGTGSYEQACRAYALNHFKKEDMLQAYYHLYTYLLSRQS